MRLSEAHEPQASVLKYTVCVVAAAVAAAQSAHVDVLTHVLGNTTAPCPAISLTGFSSIVGQKTFRCVCLFVVAAIDFVGRLRALTPYR